jgi:hypothetical protein
MSPLEAEAAVLPRRKPAAPWRAPDHQLAIGERLIVLLLILVLVGWLSSQGRWVMVHAKFAENFSLLRELQVDSIERFSQTGTWLATGHEMQGRSTSAESGRSATAELVREMGRGHALATQSQTHSALQSAWQAIAVRRGVVDGAIVTVGRFGTGGTSFALLMQPAVQEGPAPATAMWLCGLDPTLPGWQVATPQQTLSVASFPSAGWCDARFVQ